MRPKIRITNDKPTKMLSRIQSIVFFAALMVYTAATAQSYERTLHWATTPKTYGSSSTGAIKMPIFDGAVANYKDGYLPYYLENIRLNESGKITATLTNEVYEVINDNSIKSDKISTTILLKATEGMLQKKPYALLSLIPLRKNPLTGQIEKLVKFTVKLEVSATKQGRGNASYATHSVLATGNWYKVAVANTGVYKLDHDFLANKCGFDLINTNFSSIGVFGNGGGMIPDLNAVARYDDLQENPTYIVDHNGNNRVDADDYILFYGQDANRWTFNTTTALFEYEKNLYADKNYYFITPDQGTGKRIPTVASAPAPTQTITQFDDYAAHQDDKYNLLNSGKIWFGDRMSSFTTSASVAFAFPNLIASVPIHYSSSVAAYSPYSSTFTVSLGTQQLFTHSTTGITTSDYTDVYHDQTLSGTFSTSFDNLPLTYTYSNPDVSGSSNGYIYNITLNAKRALTYTGGFMPFRSVASVSSGAVSQFTLANANTNTHIWDITDITSIQDISSTLSGTTLSFAAATSVLRQFAAVDLTAVYGYPELIEKVENQDLHAIGQPKMLIVTPDDLLSPSNDLAAFHSQHDGLTVKVVRLKQIYNEYGSGKLDISAIRDFVRMVYDKAGGDSSQLPRYLLLMGDGSFDPKDRIADNNNQMPTYQSWGSMNILDSYTTDDFFGCLDPTEGGDMSNGQQMDIAMGRLPAADATEAQGMVDKIKLYKSNTALGAWRNVVTFIADEPSGSFADFQIEADKLGEEVRTTFPSNNVEKIILDAFHRVSTPGGDRYPDVNTAILNRINLGTLVISYTGHGGVNNWAHARIFNLSDIQNLTNKERLPFFVTATCDFSRFDDPSKKTAGEYLMTNARGGAIASMTTVRPVYSDANDALQDALTPFLFAPYHGRKPTVGEIALSTKNHIVGGYPSNTREFVLLGDPAMSLDYPKYNVVSTKIDNVPINQPHDTLKALKLVTIAGEIQDANGAKITSFNGICYPLVFDKLSSFDALRNDPTFPAKSFNAYKNSLFKGQCSIVNGAFSFSFIVPKDINYAIGMGRISYYADNGDADAAGYQNDIMIGGASDSLLADKEGPKIKLYMNDEHFVYGGITDPNPKLLAKLEDASGINTTGNGLGHDLTCIIDANSKNPIVLNEYYQSELNNFRKGKVVYPFASLTEGQHTLKVKAWDILNNSAEDNTEFVVASSAVLALKHVYNYPNPFTTHTEFMFEHNRPGDLLKVQVQIYAVSGRLIKTIQQDVMSEGYRVNSLRWDGLDDYGDRIGKGVYIYKVQVRDSQGATANQFQKLVVLR